MTPYRSISGGFWGAVAFVLIWLIHAVGKIDVPVEVGMALTIIVQGIGTHYGPRQPEPPSLPIEPGAK